jgi:hypothetical protein
MSNKSHKGPWHIVAIVLLLSHTIPAAVVAQERNPSDRITVSRLSYRATKMATGFGAYAVARELDISKPVAAIAAATVPVVLSKAFYAIRGQPGGKWPNAGFVLKDAGSEIIEGSAPAFMVWAHHGGKKAWWRWPVAAVTYGGLVAATWKWGTP